MKNCCTEKLFILGSIAKSTILQYRQCIAGGGFATKSRRSYCPRKADGFAAAFSGTANNTVVCNRGQYMTIPAVVKFGTFGRNQKFAFFIHSPYCKSFIPKITREIPSTTVFNIIYLKLNQFYCCMNFLLHNIICFALDEFSITQYYLFCIR